jgi:predicted methyltransferase
VIITKHEFDLIKKAKNGEGFLLKVDFGSKSAKVKVKQNKAIIDEELILDLDEKIKDNFCYLLDNQGLKKIIFFGADTNKSYKLIPTADWPTISISSVPMHKLSSPKKDSQNKIDLIRPYGLVLDTCMGLGYTAILASKGGAKIITFEKDNNVFAIAQINPLSAGLFEAANIEIRREDVAVGVKEFRDSYFDCIIHDPPTFKLAGELFSQDFYEDIMRILKEGGKLFHYTPLYKIKQGFDFPSSVKKRLKKAGFSQIQYCQVAGGFLCQK